MDKDIKTAYNRGWKDGALSMGADFELREHEREAAILNYIKKIEEYLDCENKEAPVFTKKEWGDILNALEITSLKGALARKVAMRGIYEIEFKGKKLVDWITQIIKMEDDNV